MQHELLTCGPERAQELRHRHLDRPSRFAQRLQWLAESRALVLGGLLALEKHSVAAQIYDVSCFPTSHYIRVNSHVTYVRPYCVTGA